MDATPIYQWDKIADCMWRMRATVAGVCSYDVYVELVDGVFMCAGNKYLGVEQAQAAAIAETKKTAERYDTRLDEAPSAARILRTAADVIEQRGQLRDTPDGERSMARAVAAFNELLGGDVQLTEEQGWLFMCVLKMARATAGKPHEDDWTDLAGYAALGGECLGRTGVNHVE